MCYMFWAMVDSANEVEVSESHVSNVMHMASQCTDSLKFDLRWGYESKEVTTTEQASECIPRTACSTTLKNWSFLHATPWQQGWRLVSSGLLPEPP